LESDYSSGWCRYLGEVCLLKIFHKIGLTFQGFRRPLFKHDLFDIDRRLRCKKGQDAFDQKLRRENGRGVIATFSRAVSSNLLGDCIAPILPKLLFIAASIGQPFLIHELIRFVQTRGERNHLHGVFLVMTAALEYQGLAIFDSWYRQQSTRFITKLRGYLITAIYRKLLRSKDDAKSAALTLISVDVEKILLGMTVIHELWAAAIIISVTLYLLYQQVGVIFLVLLGPLASIIVATYVLGNSVRSRQRRHAESSQKRIKFFSTIPRSMKAIKMLGLSEHVLDIGLVLREVEINAQKSLRRIVFFTSYICKPS
jgi:ABC-type bacteriocin/lantibiotic exporter with double-glycine peptidase domain